VERDISRILKSWDFKPDNLIIRKIDGDDGSSKIQIRVNLGILQMETEGRPDGKTPHDSESLLDYYSSLISEYEKRDGTAQNFLLNEQDMQELDDELMQYYHRRVCFFALKDYENARINAQHNLGLMDIIKFHCVDKDYVESHEQFRPFVIMEKARGAGLADIDRKDYINAMLHIGEAIEKIESFYQERSVNEEEIQQARELVILKKWKEQIYQEWEGGIIETDEEEDFDEI